MLNKYFIVCTFFLMVFQAPQVKESFLLLKCSDRSNGKKGVLCGYIDLKGDTVIPFGKYLLCYTDTFRKMAIVATTDKFVGIDRNDKILFEIIPFDNGPDYFSEELIRIRVNKKIGFADKNGSIVIAPQFDFVYPFSEGLAAFCIGGRISKGKEYNSYLNGKWGFIRNDGKIVISPIYDKASSFKNGIAEVVIGKKRIHIDSKGNIK